MARMLRLFFVVALFSLMLAPLALAQKHEHGTLRINIKNPMDEEVYIAFLYQNPGADDWVSEGWWTYAPGESAQIELEGACPANLYFYAESESYTWEGTSDDPLRHVVDDEFTSFDKETNMGKDLEGENLVEVAFIKVPGQEKQRTINFTIPRPK